MTEMISNAIACAMDKDLHSNKSYVELKKELTHQAILTAEYQYVQFSIGTSISAFNPVIKVVHTLPLLNSLEIASSTLLQIATANVMPFWKQRLRGWMILLKESNMLQIEYLCDSLPTCTIFVTETRLFTCPPNTEHLPLVPHRGWSIWLCLAKAPSHPDLALQIRWLYFLLCICIHASHVE